MDQTTCANIFFVISQNFNALIYLVKIGQGGKKYMVDNTIHDVINSHLPLII